MLSGGAESSKGKRGAERSSRRRWCQASQEETKRSDSGCGEARIERGYPQELSTASETRVSTPDGSSRRAAERATPATRDDGNDSPSRERDDLARQGQSATLTTTQRQPRVVDTRMTGRPEKFNGDPMKYADRLFKQRSYLGAVDQRYQEELTKTEASSTPRLNATLSSEASCALSTQMYYILVMTTTGSALDKCHNASVNEGFEAWRQSVMEWEPKLRTRYVGLLMKMLGYKFRDDIPTKLAAFERTVHDCENQSTKTVEDDIKIGVTMLGMDDMRVKEHLIRNSVRITTWNQMREEILEITRTQQYIDSQPMPMQLGANP